MKEASVLFCLTFGNNARGIQLILTYNLCYNFQWHSNRTVETSPRISYV